MEDIGRLIDIIEDHAAYEASLRFIMLAVEKKGLPEEGLLPTFHDKLAEEAFIRVLEMVTGLKY